MPKTAFSQELVGQVVGHACIPPGRQHTDTFEVAAWWVQHDFEPGGPYPVILRANRYGHAPVHSYSLVIEDAPTKVVAANLTSLFGGVGYGSNRAGQDAIGRKDARTFCLASARTLDELAAKDLSAFSFHENTEHYEIFGHYATTAQYRFGEAETFAQAAAIVRRNPADDLSILKVLRDGTLTAEF